MIACFFCVICDTVDGRNPAPVDVVVYPIIYRVLYILGDAGFLNHKPEESNRWMASDTYVITA